MIFSLTESPGEVGGEGDSSGVCIGYDSVQGAEAAREPWAAEIWWWGHHWGH